jgi:oligopeptidase B
VAHNTRSLIPPEAQRRPVQIAKHDDVRVDEFFWLRERDNPEMLRYLQAENDYTAAATAHTQALQATLYQEMIGRIRQTDASAPLPEGSYVYYERTEEGKNYLILCRRRAGESAGEGAGEGVEEIILDVNELAAGRAFCDLGEWRVSPDETLLAYSLDVEGNEAFVVHVKRLDTGELLPERIGNAYYGLEWDALSQHVFYTTLGAAHRPDSVWRHHVGDDPAHDVRVFHDDDIRFFVGVEKSSDGASLLVNLHSNTTTEVWHVPATAPTTAPQVIAPRRAAHEYWADRRGDWFYIRTNDAAQNFRVMVAPLATPHEAHWRELVPHDAQFLIDNLLTFDEHLVLFGRADGLPAIRVLHMAAGEPQILDRHDVSFPEAAYSCSLLRNATYVTKTLYFAYSSLITPNTVYAYHLQQRTFTIVKREVVAGYDPDQYVVERLWATAPDGAQVPISLAHRKGLARDGSNPAFLYGYGAYGANAEPRFMSQRISLYDRGFVVAVAHIRGGSELGRSWYKQGKLLHKRNTFTDFIACAEQLIALGYTVPARLVICGRSAGGLLMGAVTNLRPDLFAGVLAGVPFMDVINTMLDASIPLTAMEYEEWGNPEAPEEYAYMRSYSPYDNLRAESYPRLLVTAGLHDPRVQYWEPAKYVARLRLLQREHDGPNNLVLLRTVMTVGHGGPTGRYDALRETAFEYAFLLDAAGCVPAGQPE